MAVATQFLNQDNTSVTGRRRSPAVWSGFNVLACLEDPGYGCYEFHDFLSGGLITSPTTAAALVGIPYTGFSSTTGQVTYGTTVSISDQDAGTMVLAETTTREATSLRSTTTPYRITANAGLFCFEARVKTAAVGDDANELAFFIGMLEAVAPTVDIPIIASGVDTHLPSDHNMVGFKKPVADTTTFDAIYRANGQSVQTPNDGSGTFAGGTYFRVGMRFDPANQNKLSFYVNNVKMATDVTVPDNTGATFPADVALGWIIAMSVGTAASDNTLTVDWVACGQQF